ncbi:MAG: hypothetical protein KKC75_05540 [Nanoarchaeota archaeon]|nr:hypothetical protein [Nanoarchaeota archaeon]MBU1005246.1 hypothetical protein [Nanoarchaeota archaeon]
MEETKKHLNKKWEISIMEVHGDDGIRFKVTRSLPELSVSETNVFSSKEEAKKQFDEWLK